MRSKLVTRPTQLVLRIPYHPEQVQATVTVIVLQDNSIQLYGRVEQEAVGKAILEAGLARLTQWHHERQSPIVVPAAPVLLDQHGRPIRDA